MEIVVIGGGCYGSLHARQLRKAARHGRLSYARLTIVDRNPEPPAWIEHCEDPAVRFVQADWSAYLASAIDEAAAQRDVHIVPAPYAPHLFFEWLRASLAAVVGEHDLRQPPVSETVGLPTSTSLRGTPLVSDAALRAPLPASSRRAVRPPRHPHLGDGDSFAPSWRLPQRLFRLETFVCRHLSIGYGTCPRGAWEAVSGLCAGWRRRIRQVWSHHPRATRPRRAGACP